MVLESSTRTPFCFSTAAPNPIVVVMIQYIKFLHCNLYIWLLFVEYFKILQAVTIGFALMGFIGYFVKLVHIPINNIIVGGAA